MNQTLLNDSVFQMNKLYITYRQAFLLQYQNGEGYSTQHRALTDFWVGLHLQQERTVGVKLGSQGLTKFLTFDVDFKDNLPRAKEVTEELVAFLNSQYGIALEDIHIHFSGNKGYHVTLFFDKAIQDKSLHPFYMEVITSLGLQKTEVEFRASSTYGVKLPLGIHRKTGAFMGYCHYDPVSGLITQMNKDTSFEYFLGIESQSLKDFKEFVLQDVKGEAKKKAPTFTTEQAEDFENTMSGINMEGKDIEEIEKEMGQVLKANHLIYQGSRHRVTWIMPIILRDNGQPLEDTKKIVSNIMLNTFNNPETRPLISEDTTEEFALSEVNRLANRVYREGYELSTQRKDVYVTKEEILEVLSVKKYHLKKLLFSMLIHSKRHAKTNGEFYMAYSTMTHMGNTEKRSHLRKYIDLLSENKKVQIISRNQLDTIRTRIEGRVVSFPNVYKVDLKSSEIESESDPLKLQTNKDLTMEQVTALLVDRDVAKKMIPRGQWKSHFESVYVS